MDLQDRLVTAIRAGTGLNIVIAYIAPDSPLGLVPTPGSHVVDQDFAGNQDWVYNYAITVKTHDAAVATEKLMVISDYLNSLSTLRSVDGSFSFQSIEVASAPADLYQDTTGAVMYGLDIAVYVTKNNYKSEV